MCVINELLGVIYRGDHRSNYIVCNALTQLPHYNSVQSRGHYGHSWFTSISVTGQSLVDTCPLSERLVEDLCHGLTSGDSETSDCSSLA
jgi:hypothetical protein